jgi:competence protein CoiA
LLTARTKSGAVICLGNTYKKEMLLVLRNNEEFFCTVCGAAVSLKLGNQRIYHFSHRSGTVCRDFHECESVYHMKGKQQLYQWLRMQDIPAELEFYDSRIQQRPDIMFFYGGNKYALEFQCSPLPEEIFIKRTEAYYQQSYIPLWIIAGKHIKAKRSNVFSLSNFHYFFLTMTKDKQFILPTYCPDEKKFHILSSIQPYSIKNATANSSRQLIDTTFIEEILAPQISNQINFTKWLFEMEKFIINWSLHPNPEQRRFLHEIYDHSLNIYLLPSVIGLPVRYSLLIETNPIVWQTYLYLDVFQNKNVYDLIDMKIVERNFKKRIKNNEITRRNLPQLAGEEPFQAVKDYFVQLERIGLITKKSETVYQIQTRILVPNSNREREEQKNEFNRKNKIILSKI